MSIERFNDVLSRSDLQGTKRWVLAMLADRADERGICWPGVDWLATRVAVSRRTVQRCLAELVADGWLERHTNAGPSNRPDRRPSMYQIRLQRGDASVTPHGVTRDDIYVTPKAERGDKSGSNGVTLVTQRGDTGVTLTVREPSIEPSGGSELPQTPSGGDSKKTPTLAEWIVYAGSIGYLDEADAEQAWHNYEATKTAAGWWQQRGGKKITNWRSACVTCRGNWQRFRGPGRATRTGVGREEKFARSGRAGDQQDGFDSSAPNAHTGGVPMAEPAGPDESWGLPFARAQEVAS